MVVKDWLWLITMPQDWSNHLKVLAIVPILLIIQYIYLAAIQRAPSLTALQILIFFGLQLGFIVIDYKLGNAFPKDYIDFILAAAALSCVLIFFYRRMGL